MQRDHASGSLHCSGQVALLLGLHNCMGGRELDSDMARALSMLNAGTFLRHRECQKGKFGASFSIRDGDGSEDPSQPTGERESGQVFQGLWEGGCHLRPA